MIVTRRLIVRMSPPPPPTLTRCNFPTARGCCGRRGTEARGQVGLHFRFRAGCTVAPGTSRPSIPLSSWRRRRVQLLATNKHASAVMPTLPLGGPDGGWSRGINQIVCSPLCSCSYPRCRRCGSCETVGSLASLPQGADGEALESTGVFETPVL